MYPKLEIDVFAWLKEVLELLSWSFRRPLFIAEVVDGLFWPLL
jgi:hypothetical protein